MKITTIIPTYRRTKDLQRCLEALKRQTRLSDEVLVVVRDTDLETREFLVAFTLDSLPICLITVIASGVVSAMNLGLEAASGEIIAFTDDDAAPHDNWLEQIEAYFLSDDRIGGVGGRDWVYHGTELEAGAQQIVGRLQWFGRLIGNHHIGVGEPCEVDVLKGVNMSFRKNSITGLRFDERMRGSGAQVHFEVAFCLALKQAGWKLIYDPNIGVDHFRGQRFDEDKRDLFNDIAAINAIHNETLILLEYLSPLRRIVFLLWAVLIGTRDSFGFGQWLRFLSKQKGLAGRKLLASMRGRLQGFLSWRQQIEERSSSGASSLKHST
jgi:glycosyltransferase involved in cell wall biosynthesis